MSEERKPPRPPLNRYACNLCGSEVTKRCELRIYGTCRHCDGHLVRTTADANRKEG